MLYCGPAILRASILRASPLPPCPMYDAWAGTKKKKNTGDKMGTKTVDIRMGLWEEKTNRRCFVRNGSESVCIRAYVVSESKFAPGELVLWAACGSVATAKVLAEGLLSASGVRAYVIAMPHDGAHRLPESIIVPSEGTPCV